MKSKFLNECLNRGILVGSRQMNAATEASDWDIVMHNSAVINVIRNHGDNIRVKPQNNNYYNHPESNYIGVRHWGKDLNGIFKVQDKTTGDIINFFVFKDGSNLTKFIELNNYVLNSGEDLCDKKTRIKLYHMFLTPIMNGDRVEAQDNSTPCGKSHKNKYVFANGNLYRAVNNTLHDITAVNPLQGKDTFWCSIDNTLIEFKNSGEPVESKFRWYELKVIYQ